MPKMMIRKTVLINFTILTSSRNYSVSASPVIWTSRSSSVAPFSTVSDTSLSASVVKEGCVGVALLTWRFLTSHISLSSFRFMRSSLLLCSLITCAISARLKPRFLSSLIVGLRASIASFLVYISLTGFSAVSRFLISCSNDSLEIIFIPITSKKEYHIITIYSNIL